MFLFPLFSNASQPENKQLGKLNAKRSCIDVLHYNITVKVEPDKSMISGNNTITFKTVFDFNVLQLDFAETMVVDSILYKNKKIEFKRDNNAIIIKFNEMLKSSSIDKLKIYFKGNPQVAKLPPWQGGFVWSKDSLQNDWVGLACESIGASIWLPCKDHWTDESDSMTMHLTVPENLTGVSNGKLINVTNADKGYKTFHWQVLNTINNYDISINVGKYELIQDSYEFVQDKSKMPLNYYVLAYNKDKAKEHFKQVKYMLLAFEHFFGKYPFANDGYKLVETPFWGMEHQSCIAYGNNYKNNNFGFDFIIVHESGHEWFGNSITAFDPADMWIHESFTTYSESLYVEYYNGKDKAVEYLISQRPKIQNKSIIQGPRGVFYHGQEDADMYYKGTWMLHTMRTVLNNDSLWFATIKNFSKTYYHQTISYSEVVLFFNQQTKYDWTPVFYQYLNTTKIPVLVYKTKIVKGKKQVSYYFKNAVKGFALRIKVSIDNKIQALTITQKPQMIEINAESVFRVSSNVYLINIQSKSF